MLNGLFVDEYGAKRWFKDGQYHREDGPAVERKNGYNEWYKNDKCHREDGPAIERPDGTKRWYYKGFFVGQEDKPDPTLWARLTSVEVNGGSLLNGCVVDLDGIKTWYKDDLPHREDGPAVEYKDGHTNYFHEEYLGNGAEGFWNLWDRLTDKQRGNPTLLRYMPR